MKKIIITSLILIAAPLLFLQMASAQLITDTNNLSAMTDAVATQGGLGQMEVGAVIARVIKILLGFLGTIFLVLTIYAGFRWMTAAGNEDAIKKSKSMLTSAIIGLIIVLMAYAITYFVFKYLPFGGSGSSTQVITSG